MVPYCYLILLSVLILWFTYYDLLCECHILVKFRSLNDHLSGKELFIWFTECAFRELLSIYVFSYFPFGFKGRIWDLIRLIVSSLITAYFLLLVNGWIRLSSFEISKSVSRKEVPVDFLYFIKK